MSSPTPVVTKPEDVSRPEMTTVLRSHAREGRSAAIMIPEVEIRPQMTVPVENGDLYPGRI